MNQYVGRIGSARPIKSNRRIGDAIEFGNTSCSKSIGGRLIGNHIQVVCHAADAKQSLRVNACACGNILTQKPFDAGHARPIIICGDESRRSPILRERESLSRIVGLHKEPAAGNQQHK